MQKRRGSRFRSGQRNGRTKKRTKINRAQHQQSHEDDVGPGNQPATLASENRPPSEASADDTPALKSDVELAIEQYESIYHGDDAGKNSEQNDSKGAKYKAEELLERIHDALARRTLSKSVRDMPSVPKFLLYASKDPEITLNLGNATMLCRCLLLYMREDKTIPTSPAVSRARTWAGTVLLNLITADESKPYSDHPSNAHDLLANLPRDVLDSANTRLVIGELSKRLRAVQDENAAQAVYDLLQDFAPVVSLPEVRDLIDKVIATMGRLPIPINSKLAVANRALPPAVTEYFRPMTNASAFRLLSFESQVVLLRLSAEISAEEISRLKSLMSKLESVLLVDFDDEQNEMLPLASAAAEEVHLHLTVFGCIERDIMANSEPFSCRQWKDRQFMRALHFAVDRRIGEIRDVPGMDARKLHRACPLYRRYGPDLRCLVSALCTFGRYAEPSIAGLSAVFDALRVLACVEDGNDDYIENTVVPIQAILLAMDAHLQLVFVSAAMEVSRMRSSDHRERMDTIRKMSIVISAVDVVRLPGGSAAVPVVGQPRRSNLVFAALRRMFGHCSSRQSLSTIELDSTLYVPDSLMAAISVGCGITLDRTVRSGVYFIGEVLRVCEIVRATSSPETRHALQLNDVFRSAVSTALRAIEDDRVAPIETPQDEIRQNLLRRQQKWLNKPTVSDAGTHQPE